MDRGKRPPYTRHAMSRAVALLLALMLAGCGGHSNVQLGASGAPATGVSTGGSVSMQGRSTLAVLLGIGILAGASHGSERMAYDLRSPVYAPELDPSRRIVERDCTRPIEDWSANLKCR